ncbi:MAG: cytochrome c [Chitinophagaceae bacterium]|nr:cytochrome c [Chitinophagaceae bacterium]
MRRRLIPVNVVISALLFILLSLDPDQTKPPEVVMKRGQMIYERECMSCHRQDGSGTPGTNPSLSKTEWVLGPKQRLIKILLNDFTGPVEVDGDVFQNAAPPHKHLSDQEVADVLSYVRNSFGNRTGAVAAREVKKIRLERK